MLSQKGKLLTWDSGEKMLQRGDRKINEKGDKVNYWPTRPKDMLKNKGKVFPRQKSEKFNDLPPIKRG